MNTYIGADLGTSALKLLLVDENGAILNTVSESYEVSYPRSGWSEQRPEDWWDALIRGIGALTEHTDKHSIRGIGVAGQMHGLVILDENDQVIRPAILWNDGRTQRETDALNTEVGKERLSRMTANIAFAGFTAPKLLWLQKNEPEAFRRIRKIMLPKDYLNYRLTGVHATDYSDASGTLLLDVEHRRWSREMAEICHVREELLPELFESVETIGTIRPEIAEMLGLDRIPVAAGAGDNAAAAIGTGTVGNGRCNISLGTSGTVFISSDSFTVDRQNALHSFCHADGGYHLLGCMLSAASCNQWFCGDVLHTSDFAAEQAAIDPKKLGRNSVFFLPYLMGERSPVNDTDASGVFLGMRPDTKRADLLQAILEGVSFATRDNLEVAKQQGITLSSATVCGGGARSPLWRKILSNVLNLPLYLPACEEGPGYGAALLAMGRIAPMEQKMADLTEPDPDMAALYETKYRLFRTIYPTLKPLFKEAAHGKD